MFSQTLGTALGDWTADTAGLGYLGAALIFSAMLLVVLLLYLLLARVAHAAVLGRLRADPTARRSGRRLPGQADCAKAAWN